VVEADSDKAAWGTNNSTVQTMLSITTGRCFKDRLIRVAKTRNKTALYGDAKLCG
jgi:hypothetical protein